MSKLQIFSIYDRLKDFKVEALNKYHDCAFFEGPVNGQFDIGTGLNNNCSFSEQIITDGQITLCKKNNYLPNIIYQNALIKLKSGLSIEAEISDASFFVNITRCENGNKEVNVHVEKEDSKTLTRILELIYQQKPTFKNTSSIKAVSGGIIIIEKQLNSKYTKEKLDLKKGIQKSLKPTKRKR